jgi:CRP-like cAMP-binding protein
MGLVSQTAACNRLHSVQQRLAKYLLMVQDRARSNNFVLTQEFLAEMIGTQRTTITHIAGALQRLGYIEYTRGRMTILDRTGLESAACECFRATMSQLSTLYN